MQFVLHRIQQSAHHILRFGIAAFGGAAQIGGGIALLVAGIVARQDVAASPQVGGGRQSVFQQQVVGDAFV